MTSDMPQDIQTQHLSALLALNNEHYEMLSYLEEEELPLLLSGAYYARQMGAGQGMLIAFTQDADYDSPNFRWFQERFERFVYIDRVVVSEAARGKGFASKLYEDLYARSACDGFEQVCCEVNITPPNPGSHTFHQAHGFAQIGEAELAPYREGEMGKKVAYYARPLVK